MSEKVLQVEDLSYRPEDQPVLDGVSFAVQEGEFISIIGPNGAGKSTLLRHLNRLLPVTEGKVLLYHQPIAGYPFRALARLATYVPQAKGFVPPYRVGEFLLMSRYPYLSSFQPPGPADRELVREVLERVGMSTFASRYLDTLSGGERQKIYLAAAMVQQARLVLLDEPTTFLDPLHSLEIVRLLRNWHREEGRTILMVTHDVNAALRLSDRILALRGGQVLYCGLPAGLDDGIVLRRLYGVPFLRLTHPEPGGGTVFVPPGVEA